MDFGGMKLIEAAKDMLDEINMIYINCRESLIRNGILQWDDHYPNKDYFRECIEDDCLYVLVNEEEILGHVVLNEWESDEWEIIPWKGSNCIVIHSLMIHPRYEGNGLGAAFVKLCEGLAREKQYKSIRLDAFSGNPRALSLYKKLGYEQRGSVYFTSKPEGHQQYICFEKAL